MFVHAKEYICKWISKGMCICNHLRCVAVIHKSRTYVHMYMLYIHLHAYIHIHMYVFIY